jgi:acyl-CoA reductase-like NAD-dependent aldehyde dehydrogenase
MTVIEEMVEKARIAQQKINYYNQEQTDEMVRIIGKAIYDHAKELAEEAAEETQFGNAEAKQTKNEFFSSALWYHLKDKKSVGEIERNEETGIIKNRPSCRCDREYCTSNGTQYFTNGKCDAGAEGTKCDYYFTTSEI